MSKLQDIAAANLNQEPSATPSFRERTLSRLQAETGANAPTGPDSPNQDSTAGQSAARQAEDVGYTAAELEALKGYPDDDSAAVLQTPEADAGQVDDDDTESLTAQADEETTSEAADEVTDGEPSEPEEGTVEWWQAQAANAEKARHDMERDYRQKTHKIGALTRDLEQSMAQAVTENAFYVGRAEQAIQQQFGQINWDVLRSDPERYEKTRQAYQRAIGIRDEAARRQQALQQQLQVRIDAARDQEAELSRSILKKSVPGWSNKRVLELRDFAEREGLYTGEAFDDITDWQRMVMLDSMEKMQTASTKIKVPRKRRGKKPAAGVNKGHKPLRNAQGQFQDSRQAMWNDPTDRSARRNFFMDKLAAERGGR